MQIGVKIDETVHMEALELLGSRYIKAEQVVLGPVQTFRAQNAATWREVFIHRVSTTEAPTEQANLLKLLTTALVRSSEAKRLVLDFGEEQGFWHVVTESEPQCEVLRDWLHSEVESAQKGEGLLSAEQAVAMGEFARLFAKGAPPLARHGAVAAGATRSIRAAAAGVITPPASSVITPPAATPLVNAPPEARVLDNAPPAVPVRDNAPPVAPVAIAEVPVPVAVEEAVVVPILSSLPVVPPEEHFVPPPVEQVVIAEPPPVLKVEAQQVDVAPVEEGVGSAVLSESMVQEKAFAASQTVGDYARPGEFASATAVVDEAPVETDRPFFSGPNPALPAAKPGLYALDPTVIQPLPDDSIPVFATELQRPKSPNKMAIFFTILALLAVLLVLIVLYLSKP